MPTKANPLLPPWTGPLGMPRFAEVELQHFPEAFDVAIVAQTERIAAIAGDKAEPSFDNTISALELSGRELDCVGSVFFNLAGTDTNDEIQKIEREIAPRLARHRSAIYLNGGLFRRIEKLVEEAPKLGLSDEQRRVLDRYHTLFVRAGAKLGEQGRLRLAAIMEELASLGTTFSQNLLADERDFVLPISDEAQLSGLPESLRDAAAQAASDRKLGAPYAITLSRSSVEPFLQFADRRELREEMFRAWTGRGEKGGATDNRETMAQMVALRAERAKLLGYKSFADYRLDDSMAKTPKAADDLLRSVWEAGRARAGREAADLSALISEDGGNFELAPWDWRYYAEKLRKRRFDFDEAELKPYLQLDKMIEAAFYTAGRLFGLKFAERRDIPLHNPDARIWEVSDAEGRNVGLFVGDYFARTSKKSGAWMSSFRSQHRLDGEVRPIIINVMNFAKPPKGEPALLSFDDARTLFHEFGHALHGLLSDVTYPLISGTNVARDFVELPSQLYEHWLEQKEVLERFAVHAETGKPMPPELLKKVMAARTFNQGFATVEYTSSAIVDLDLHQTQSEAKPDVVAFEKKTLADIAMPEAIVMRHRTPHFGHIFSGEGYAAGYYSYLWSEVLDADGFEAFKEAGDIFDAKTAERLKKFIYSAGSLRPPDEAYKAFRGRMPLPRALLEKRGLTGSAGGD